MTNLKQPTPLDEKALGIAYSAYAAYYEGCNSKGLALAIRAYLATQPDFKALADKLAEALKFYANKTQSIEEPCPGNHTNYSSMFDLPTCKLCGKNEDTRGGKIWKTIPHPDSQTAQKALAEYSALAELKGGA